MSLCLDILLVLVYYTFWVFVPLRAVFPAGGLPFFRPPPLLCSFFERCAVLEWLQSHILYILLFVAAVFTFDWLYQCRAQLRLRWYSALILAVLHVVVGVACVRFFAFAEAGFDAEKAGNLSLFGGIIILPAFYFLGAKLTKRSVAAVFDVFTIPLAATLLLARINCFFGGCCLGKLIGETGMRWPTREAELVFYAVFIVLTLPRVFKGRGKGEVYPLFMIAYGAFRAVDECFRENPNYPGIFHLSHVWAFAVLALGILILILLRKRGASPAKAKRPAAKPTDRRNTK